MINVIKKNSESKINILLFHRIIIEKYSEFEDISYDKFEFILKLIKSNQNKNLKFIITFDDGNNSDYLYALPLLLRYNIPAIFFVVADKINTKGYLSKYQLCELVRNGMKVGSHSYTHPDMTSLSCRNSEQEFIISKKIIEDTISEQISSFSFPFGKLNSNLINIANNCGYKNIYTSKHGLANKNNFIYPRNSFNSMMNINRYKNYLFPTWHQEIVWKNEDWIKYSIKLIIGDSKYSFLRNFILNYRKND